MYWAGLVFVFLLALLLRLTYPLSRPVPWYNRSVAFWDALLAGNWADTYHKYHPGVTTMWVAGLGLRLYALANGWSSADLYEAQTVISGLPGQPHIAGVAALAVVVAACIGLAYVLADRLAGWPAAFVAGCLLALDPFYIVQSKILHVDALLASFMLVSALFLLCYLKRASTVLLVSSAVFAGLAFLTKSSSGFLVPFAIAALAWQRLWRGRHRDPPPPSTRSWRRRFRELGRDLAVWGLGAGCIVFILWPAMWVKPVEMVSVIVTRAVFHIQTEHYNPGFFAGSVIGGNPGLLFYPAAIVWKTTLVTLPALLAAVFFLSRRARHGERDWPIWWLLAYACGFALMMSVAARKELRYLLPVFPALDVLAAWGLVQVATSVGRGRHLRNLGWAPAALLAVALIAHGVAVLRHNPHYGTHHNLLLGGSRVAQHILTLGDQGEGLDLAARFLNAQDRAERLTAGLQQRGSRVFRRNFEGHTLPIDSPSADYWVFHINPIQRGLGEERWGDVWDESQRTEPIWSVSFDGVPYAWIYPTYPDDPASFAIEHPLDVQMGEHIDLLGYRLSTSEVAAGDTLTVTLFWQSGGQVTSDIHIFVHLLDGEGELAAQHDGVPGRGERPTWTWRDAEVIEDLHTLDTAGLPAGVYALHVGMYDYATGARLSAASPTSTRPATDSLWLEDIVITLP